MRVFMRAGVFIRMCVYKIVLAYAHIHPALSAIREGRGGESRRGEGENRNGELYANFSTVDFYRGAFVCSCIPPPPLCHNSPSAPSLGHFIVYVSSIFRYYAGVLFA